MHWPWSRLHRTLSGILPCEARTFLACPPFGSCSRDYLSYLQFNKYNTYLSELQYQFFFVLLTRSISTGSYHQSGHFHLPLLWQVSSHRSFCGCPCMSLHPDKCNLVRFFCFQQTFPEICILHRLILAALPSLLQPAVDPMLVKSIYNILGIRI